MKKCTRGRRDNTRKNRSSVRVRPKRRSRVRRKRMSPASKYLKNPTIKRRMKN